MNRSLVILLSVLALASAQPIYNCFTNGTTFATVCTTNTNNAECNWENAALWTNCNNTEPDSIIDNAVITPNGATAFTLFVNGSAVTAANVTMNAAGSILYVNEDLDVSNVYLQAGSVVVANSDITLGSTAVFSMSNGTSLSLNAGTLTGNILAPAGTAITFNAGANVITNNVNTAANVNFISTSATFNGITQLNGPITFSGANTIAGTGPLYLNGLYLQQSDATITNTFSIPTNVTGTVEANTTVVFNANLAATTLTVDPTGSITLNTAAAPGVFNFSNVYVNNAINTVNNATTVVAGQLTWGSGNLFNAGTMVNNGSFTISSATTSNGTNPTLYGTLSNNGAIVVNTPAVVLGRNILTDNFNMNGGSLSGQAGASVVVEANITWTAGEITVPALTALGSFTIIGNTGNSTYKMLSSAVTAGNVMLNGALSLGADYVNPIINSNSPAQFVGEAASISAVPSNYGSTTFTNNGVLDGNINWSGVNLISTGTIGAVNVTTAFAFTDASINLTNTSLVVVGVGSSNPDPIFSFSKTNGTNITVTNVWGGVIEFVILPSFNPTSDLNVILLSGSNAVNNLNFGNMTINTNITIMNGANANKCTIGTPIVDTANYQVTIQVTECSAASSPANKTLIIVIVVVVVVLVIAAIIGVVVYRRRQHAHSAEKQRLI